MLVDDAPAIKVENGACSWWETRICLTLVVAATMLPLLYPPIPPLVDLIGHIGRYRVELDLSHSPFLQRYYEYHWAPISNLGVDALILPLGSLFGLEPSVKLIVLAIPPLTAAGMVWISREIHGRVPPTTFFALPFIYGFPFLFGFVNFALSATLAFLAFGLWLRLGRLGRTGLRAFVFTPVSLALFYCHAYGLGLLGLMCFPAETIRLHDRGRSWLMSTLVAALQMSVMVIPVAAAMFLTAPGAVQGGVASGWFDWGPKWIGLYGTLRDRWGPFDVASLEIAGLVLLFALLSPKLGYSRRLGLAALSLSAAFVILPRYLFDSAYADVRLLPYLFALALLAIGPGKRADLRLDRSLAILGIAFFAMRLGGTTLSFAIAAKDQEAKLEALQTMPRGARVASFYGLPVAEPWALQRDSHLGGMVLARREGFSNDQWITGAYNLLVLKYKGAEGFSYNPSQIVRPNGQGDAIYRTIDQALTKVPRDKFDYIWLIETPPFDRKLTRDLQPVWNGRGAILYRIPH